MAALLVRTSGRCRSRYQALWLGVLLLLLCFDLYPQEPCDFEAKLLLPPSQTKAAIAALHAGKETAGYVYLYDTPSLDLLSHGVIVRLRRGSDNDLTVKLRPTTGQTFSDPSAGREDYKCEVDMTGIGPVNSYSIRRPSTVPPPATSGEIYGMLSPGQRKLLEQSQVAIDWSRVKKIVGIRYTAWQSKSQPKFKKLALELWEWPGGRVLELSTKVEGEAGPATYQALQRLAQEERLSLSTIQGPKTNLVLRSTAQDADH